MQRGQSFTSSYINESIELTRGNKFINRGSYFPLKRVTMLLIVSPSNDSEKDFAHKSSLVSVSEDAHRQCSNIVCWLSRRQHEQIVSDSATNSRHLIYMNTPPPRHVMVGNVRVTGYHGQHSPMMESVNITQDLFLHVLFITQSVYY